MSGDTNNRVFVVMSQTGTVLSRILKMITGAEYNHVSIGLSEELDTMYSFGRLNAYNPFFGGFVVESPHYGTFKRFKNTKVMVLSLEVGSEKHKEISEYILNVSSNRKKYHYNYFGLYVAIFKKVKKKENCFYCSEFVRDVLRNSSIKGSHEMPEIVQPIHFLSLPSSEIIYKGKLRDYKNIRSTIAVK